MTRGTVGSGRSIIILSSIGLGGQCSSGTFVMLTITFSTGGGGGVKSGGGGVMAVGTGEGAPDCR